MEHIFLDLGKQPIANNFLTASEIKNEFFYNLKVKFDDNTKLVSLVDFVPPEKMFHDKYAYHSSNSQTMINHFKLTAEMIKTNYKPKKILEIGSNDGVFLKHFNTDQAFAVEPCGNFCDMTNNMGYETYQDYWTPSFAKKLLKKMEWDFIRGESDYGFDVVYAANCMCHIQNLDEAFEAINFILNTNGVFIFEDPSLLHMLANNSYDQIYDEHAHIFSVTALNNLLNKHNLDIFKVVYLPVHGGSNRIYVKKKYNHAFKYDKSVITHLLDEQRNGIGNLKTYLDFADRVEKSKNDFIDLLKNIKEQGKTTIGYGATSKSTTIFNYCKIDDTLIQFVVDTTESKQGKFYPGTHIPVLPYHKNWHVNLNYEIDYAFLGAWNYENEILNKEKEFIKKGGRFITHVPYIRILP